MLIERFFMNSVFDSTDFSSEQLLAIENKLKQNVDMSWVNPIMSVNQINKIGEKTVINLKPKKA